VFEGTFSTVAKFVKQCAKPIVEGCQELATPAPLPTSHAHGVNRRLRKIRFTGTDWLFKPSPANYRQTGPNSNGVTRNPWVLCTNIRTLFSYSLSKGPSSFHSLLPSPPLCDFVSRPRVNYSSNFLLLEYSLLLFPVANFHLSFQFLAVI